jgi:hypothetical protein
MSKQLTFSFVPENFLFVPENFLFVPENFLFVPENFLFDSKKIRLFLCLLVLTAFSASMAVASDPCFKVLSLTPGDVFEGSLATAEEQVFELLLPTAGFLSLTATTPFGSAAVKLGVLPRACDGAAHEGTALRQFVAATMLATKAGTTLAVRIAAEDRDVPFTTYRLHSHFVAAEDLADAGAFRILDPLTGYVAGSDPDDDVIVESKYAGSDPDDDVIVEGKYAGSDPDDDVIVENKSDTTSAGTRVRELKVDVTTPGVLGIRGIGMDDAEGLTILAAVRPGSYRLRLRSTEASRLDNLSIRHFDVCGAGQASVSSLCAPTLTSGAAVALAGSDELLSFSVAAQGTVKITSSGETDTAGALYDRHGHRLASDDDGGERGNFRLVKTLVPGEYFLRVESRGTSDVTSRVHLEELRPTALRRLTTP